MTKYFYKKQHQTSITAGVLGQSRHISLSRRLDKQVLEMSVPVIKQKQGDSTTCKKTHTGFKVGLLCYVISQMLKLNMAKVSNNKVRVFTSIPCEPSVTLNLSKPETQWEQSVDNSTSAKMVVKVPGEKLQF